MTDLEATDNSQINSEGFNLASGQQASIASSDTEEDCGGGGSDSVNRLGSASSGSSSLSRPGSSDSTGGGSSRPTPASKTGNSRSRGGRGGGAATPGDDDATGASGHSRHSSCSSGDGLVLSVSALTSGSRRQGSRQKLPQSEDKKPKSDQLQDINSNLCNHRSTCCEPGDDKEEDTADNMSKNDASSDASQSCPCSRVLTTASISACHGATIAGVKASGGVWPLVVNSCNGGQLEVASGGGCERLDPEGINEQDGEDDVDGGSAAGFTSLLAVDRKLFGRLQEELTAAQSELKLKEEEVTRLSRIRVDIEAELEELTASLFQEAHKMVQDANLKRIHAEKLLTESEMKVDGLQTEVAALKALVITSTPSRPNHHLHPQIDPARNSGRKGRKGNHSPAGGSAGPSSLLGGGDSASGGVGGSSPGSPVKSGGAGSESGGDLSSMGSNSDIGFQPQEKKLMDPVLRGEYLQWKKLPTMDFNQPFLARIFSEDVNPCLEFPNGDLGSKLREAVLNNHLSITPVKDDEELPRNCSLLEQPRTCSHRLSLGDQDADSHHICKLARNRIAAVCDFLTYCRYVTQGLVKSHSNNVYWEFMNLRKNMTLARLGFNI